MFARIGAFDHLVLSAVPGATVTVRDLTSAAARPFMDTKFWGYYDAVRAAADVIAKDGSITLIGGGASRKHAPGRPMMAAINAALEAFGKANAVDLAPIRVNVIAHGLVDTPAYAGLPEEIRQGMFAAYASSVPARPGRCPRGGSLGRAVPDEQRLRHRHRDRRGRRCPGELSPPGAVTRHPAPQRALAVHGGVVDVDQPPYVRHRFPGAGVGRDPRVIRHDISARPSRRQVHGPHIGSPDQINLSEAASTASQEPGIRAPNGGYACGDKGLRSSATGVAQAPIASLTGCSACIFIHRSRARGCAGHAAFSARVSQDGWSHSPVSRSFIPASISSSKMP